MRDPIEFELFKNGILSIADEMALTIARTAYSGVLRDNIRPRSRTARAAWSPRA